MAKKAKNAAVSLEPDLTLAQLSERYLKHMEKDGKSSGTTFSYGMELKTAQSELGADTLVASITPEQIDVFNRSKRVTKLKSGKPKAQPSVLKTQRVIRLALTWAAQSGLIARAPYAAKGNAVVTAPVASTTHTGTRTAPTRDQPEQVDALGAPSHSAVPVA